MSLGFGKTDYIDPDDSSVSEIEQYIISVVNSVVPKNGSILPSEMVAFVSECVRCGVKTIIESGRRHGYSTEVLCRFPEDWWDVIHSVEINPVKEDDERLEKNYHNLRLHVHDSMFMVPNLVNDAKGPIGLLVDGPKGLQAYDLLNRVKRKCSVIGLHDCYPGSDLREILEERESANRFFTDSEWFLEQYGELDKEAFKVRGIESHQSLFRTGSVMGVLVINHD